VSRYLFCLPRFHTNAAPWAALLAQSGHKVAFHVTRQEPTENYHTVRPVLLAQGRISRLLGHLASSRQGGDLWAFPGILDYWRLLAYENPDVVIVRGLTRWFSRIAALTALLQRRRLVVYDQEELLPRRLGGTWYRRAFCQLLGIPTVSTRIVTAEWSPGLGRAYPLPFGCGFDEALVLEAQSRKLSWPPRILMVAKYRHRKGHSELLRALALLPSETDYSLTFCGEEATLEDSQFCQDLERLADELGLSRRLSFINNVPNDKIFDIYSRHDLFVLPSRSEPCAVAPAEASWCGCAVLLSRTSGSRGYVPSGPEFEFDCTSPEDIASALSGALGSRAKLSELRDACRLHIRNIAGSERVLDVLSALASGVPLRRHDGGGSAISERSPS
jgi:glycosyltransferase involved in cell wall biosynthesis